MFAAVPKEELQDTIARMNAYMQGMTKQEKEMAVTELIFSTGSRVLPGVRFLPDRLYEENSVPPENMVDEHGRNVDGEGLPLIETDEEVMAFQQGNYRNSQTRDVRMPSTRANLPDPSTESDSPLGKKRRGEQPQEKLPWQESSDEVSVAVSNNYDNCVFNMDCQPLSGTGTSFPASHSTKSTAARGGAH